MSLYGTTHLVALAVFGIGLIVVIRLGLRDRGRVGPGPISRGFAVLSFVSTFFFQVYDLVEHYERGTSLPLHLCDVAWMFSVWALWTHGRYPTAVTWFWGMLTLIAIFAPATEDFPTMRYFGFWTMHMVVVWAAFYLGVARGLAAGWWGFRRTIDTTLAWAAVAYVVNLIIDSNYGFLMRPARNTPMEWLGPWPWYVIAQFVLALIVWAVLVLTLGGRAQPGSTSDPVSS